MKTSLTLLVMALVVLAPAFADEPEAAQKVDNAKVVKNLIYNLQSENKGVIESSAYMLGEMKSTEAVVPLLAILHDSPYESSRIVAALSLSKIGAARGMFAVKQAVRFDESPRVRLVCAWFANQYEKPEPFAFIRLDEAQDMNITARTTPDQR